MSHFDSLIGIDVSAARDAADRLWIALARPERDRLRLSSLLSARELFGRSRREVIDGLVRFLAHVPGALVACDVCFGLPSPLTDAPWHCWLLRYPFATPEEVRAAGRASGGGELRRLTDRLVRAPMAPTNLRLYRQTHLWLREVLRPLVAASQVTVAPFQPARPPTPHLIEVCPAVSLRTWQLPSRGYKGRTESHRRTRAAIVAALRARCLDIPDQLTQLAVAQAGGDALDAVVAAVTAWAVDRHEEFLRILPPEAFREGWIYVAPLPCSSPIAW